MGGDGVVVGVGSGAYMSRGRTLAEVIFAVVCVGFLTGFVAFLCIGNCYRARRAAERQRQRRLANKLLTAPGGAVAIHALNAEGRYGGGGGGGGYNYGHAASGPAGAGAASGAAAAMNGGDMSPQSSTSSSGVGAGAGGEGIAHENDNHSAFGSRRFNQSQERTRLISNRNYEAAQQGHHDAPRRRGQGPDNSSRSNTNNTLLLSEQDEYNFPPHTANLMSV